MAADDPVERCAVLALSIGEDAAAEVFKHMSAAEVQSIGKAMVEMKRVTRAQASDVLQAFRDEAEQFLAVSLSSEDYIRSVLNRALGSERAAGILDDILEPETHAGIDALNNLDPAAIVEIIKDEHPQIITTILVHLARDRASGVLALLPERTRNDVFWRIATFGGVQPAALAALTDVLNGVLAGQISKRGSLGGTHTAAEILNMMKDTEEASLMETIKERDAELAQRIEEEMFVFADLEQLEDTAIAELLQQVQNDSLIIALKGAPEGLIEKFLSNMSARLATLVRDELAEQGPLRLSKVETERKKVVQIARRLADDGKIQLKASSDDEYV
ncbi:MAG: flagellar motor switch protein FliG [Candidimonas sp.]|nr:MAG: flagellar motor switch protein FliG [Candidimonas sp.]